MLTNKIIVYVCSNESNSNHLDVMISLFPAQLFYFLFCRDFFFFFCCYLFSCEINY